MSESGSKSGWVYLIHAEGTNRYKIGRTIDISRRVAELTYQSPYPLEIISYFKSDYPSEDELALHEKFADRRVHGEWFKWDCFNSFDFFPLGTYMILSRKYLYRLLFSLPPTWVKSDKIVSECIEYCRLTLELRNFNQLKTLCYFLARFKEGFSESSGKTDPKVLIPIIQYLQKWVKTLYVYPEFPVQATERWRQGWKEKDKVIPNALCSIS